jgi:cytochrome P450
MLTKIIRGNPETNEKPLSDYQIAIEISNFTFAATDTTGNTMAYALYRLAAQPYWQKLLREELRSNKVAEKDYSFQSLQDLPMLNGVTYETLRLHPGAPSALPRITPPEGCKIGGRFVPGNVCSRLTLSAFVSPADYLLDPCLDAIPHHTARSRSLPQSLFFLPQPLGYD